PSKKLKSIHLRKGKYAFKFLLVGCVIPMLTLFQGKIQKEYFLVFLVTKAVALWNQLVKELLLLSLGIMLYHCIFLNVKHVNFALLGKQIYVLAFVKLRG
ncbi:hypothetical protein HMI55_006705, partial [Coelomomyces lativittatus]